MSPVVDMTGVPIGFQPMPDVDKAKISFTGFENMKNKNRDDMVRIELTVLEPEEHAGHKVFLNHNITPQGMPFLKETMVLLGAEPDSLEGTINTDDVLNELLTNEAYAKIGHREYNGKTYNDATLLVDDSWTS